MFNHLFTSMDKMEWCVTRETGKHVQLKNFRDQMKSNDNAAPFIIIYQISDSLQIVFRHEL